MIDTALLWGRAESAMRHGWHEDALGSLRKLIEAVDRIDFEYDEWLRALIECLRHLNRHDEVAACQAYLGALPIPSHEALSAAVAKARAGDLRSLSQVRLWGIALSRSGHSNIAAKCFGVAAMPVHQAIELERSRQDHEASQIWAKLLNGDRLADHPYEAALVRINLGLCLHRLGEPEARNALAEAMRAVEEVADRYESEGLRERAFDCYQLLGRIGLETDTFENVAEGYLNSVRILRDDGLKLDALRLYEGLVGYAKRSHEYHAAAGILREAAEFCVKMGLSYGDDLRWRCAEAWVGAAEAARNAELPLQIVENAYLSAAEAFVSVRAFRQVATVYQALAALDGKNSDRYQRLLTRLGHRPEDPPRPIPVPEYIKRLPDYEEVWYVDLAEWEIDGDPMLVAGGILADRRFPDYVRRHALLLVLDLVRQVDKMSLVETIRRLEAIRAYPVLDVLEHLFRRGDATIQREVCSVLGSFRFKRTFTLIWSALASDEPSVRLEAAKSVSRLYFSHAFDRLRKIYERRDWPEPELARSNALAAIGKINSAEAVEYLCQVMVGGDVGAAEFATAALCDLNNPELLPVLRQQIDVLPQSARAVLEDTIARLSPKGR
jgi:tetratricopeptide (TPR) repeat protein